MKIVLILCVLCLLPLIYGNTRAFISPRIDPLSDLMVETINSLNTTWKAGKNFNGLSLRHIKRLCGVRKRKRFSGLRRMTVPIGLSIPVEFDSRDKWPECPSISFIRDQGSCGSCWAFSSAEAMSDRTCIGSNGTIKVELSPEDVLACCTDCGYGCNGGFPESAYEYWVSHGIVTGGLYKGEGCQPYKIEPCEHHVPGPRPDCTEEPTPSCEISCQPSYNKTYLQDKHYGKKHYILERDNVQIQSEIMSHGPVTATFDVYTDFVVYKSGVYQRHSNEMLGSHAIRILGWGVEDDTPYWLIANSWNSDWGDQGYFKIRRGNNECGIENYIVTGLYKN